MLLRWLSASLHRPLGSRQLKVLSMSSKFVNFVILFWCNYIPIWKWFTLLRASGKVQRGQRRKHAPVEYATQTWFPIQWIAGVGTCFHRGFYLQTFFRDVTTSRSPRIPPTRQAGITDLQSGALQCHRLLVHYKAEVKASSIQSWPSVSLPPCIVQRQHAQLCLGPLDLPLSVSAHQDSHCFSCSIFTTFPLVNPDWLLWVVYLSILQFFILPFYLWFSKPTEKNAVTTFRWKTALLTNETSHLVETSLNTW